VGIKQEFQQWIGHLRRLRLPVADMLLPGVDPGIVRRAFSDASLDCPDDVVEFYQCSGGVSAPERTLLNRMWMYGSHYMLPFERAAEDYAIFCTDSRWDRSWFPIFGNDGGDFYSICSRSDRSDWKNISYFMVNSGTPSQIRFSSLLNMMIVINECFDREVCFVDQNGNLETNFLEAAMIAMKHNPNLSYYTKVP
jgi:hypothetical protein